MSRRLVALLATLLSLSFLAGCGDDGEKATDDGSDGSDGDGTSVAAPPDREATGVMCKYTEDGWEPPRTSTCPRDATVSGQVAATIETSAGTFTATLDADAAPCTVNSFVSLADQGYFNDTTCHRMVTAGIFVLQCGDPTRDRRRRPGLLVRGRADGTETYGPGTLAMANAGPEHQRLAVLHGVRRAARSPPSYTVFGSVDDATVELIEKVAEDGTDPGFGTARPNTPVEIETVVAE